MKRLLFISLSAALLLHVSACRGSRTDPGEGFDAIGDEPTHGPVDLLLPGYPEELLPLYKSTRVNRCAFSYREDYGYVIGKDFYAITYESEAEPGEIAEYYRSLLTMLDEVYSDDQFLQGAVGNNPVQITLEENFSGPVTVHMHIGLAVEDYLHENPYFDDYPEDLVEVFGFYTLQKLTYEEQHAEGKTIRYLTVYESTATPEEFAQFYQTRYGRMMNFSEAEEDFALVYSWQSGDYRCRVYYSTGPVPSISIEVMLQ